MPRSRRLRALAMGLVSVCGGVGQDLEQPSDLAVLHCLHVDPFADQLLLAANVVDEALEASTVLISPQNVPSSPRPVM